MELVLLSPDAKVPTRKHGSAGYDLYSTEDLVIPSLGTAKVRLGISIALPENTYGRIAPRSGLALKGIDVGGGVIDGDYRGEVAVVLFNHGSTYRVHRGDRIAQLIIIPILTPEIKVVSELS